MLKLKNDVLLAWKMTLGSFQKPRDVTIMIFQRTVCQAWVCLAVPGQSDSLGLDSFAKEMNNPINAQYAQFSLSSGLSRQLS